MINYPIKLSLPRPKLLFSPATDDFGFGYHVFAPLPMALTSRADQSIRAGKATYAVMWRSGRVGG